MIKNIKINNYKCFKNFEIKAFKRINILVGDNNSGKTSLLEAIALLDPKTFKAKNDVIKNAISFCTDSYLKNKDDLPNKFMLAFFKKIFEDYSIFFNKRNIEEPIFIEADFNSLKKDSKSDFLVKFENQIIKEIVDFPERNSHPNITKTIQRGALGLFESIVATYKFSNKKNLLKLGVSSIGTYNDNVEGFDNFDVIFKKINDRANLVKNWTQIINQNGVKIEEKFVKLLQNFDGDIEAIRANQDELDFYKKNPENKKSPFVIPLSSMGEGFKRFFDIIITLELINKNNNLQILCIDEIDNGLYFDKQDIYWEQIIKLCEEKNIQLFATTHSYDSLKSLSSEIEKLYKNNTKIDKELALYSLYKGKEGEIKSFKYDYDLFKAKLESSIELR
jgi:AAA15 family ATPase/GTPase